MATLLRTIIEDPKWADTEIKMLRFKVANLKEDARIFENLKKDARELAEKVQRISCYSKDLYDLADRIIAATDGKK
jgi:hypothetical protein